MYFTIYGYVDASNFLDMHDADTADLVIQYALFKEQIFC